MKILLLSEVFPPQTGGSGRWFWEIYRRMDPADTALLVGAQPQAESFDRAQGLNLQREPMSFSSWGISSLGRLQDYRNLAGKVADVVRAERPDQIHCGKVLPEGFVAWWLKRTRAIPYLCYVHGEELNISGRSRELGWLTRRTLESAEHVIANSHNTAELLQRDWSVKPTQLRVLHPGVDVDRFHPADREDALRESLGWRDRAVILTVGRLQKRKGHDQLIRALPRLRKSQPRVLYSIIGDGPERNSLTRLVEEIGVTDQVEFRGEVSDAEMVTCYQQCDLFALPNRTVEGDFEGFGMVLLEAQACGRPVVAGDSGGTKEAMWPEHSGLIVDCESLDALTTTLQTLLSDPVRCQTMGACGRGWTQQHFSWDALVNQAQDVFAGVDRSQCVDASSKVTS